MRLLRFLLRYHPPGIILEFRRGDAVECRILDLLDLNEDTDLNAVVADIARYEPLITEKRKAQVLQLLQKLRARVSAVHDDDYHEEHVIKAHPLPLTNIDVSKDGRRCVSASYDRTCILWDTTTGEELQVFEGHKNVVQAVIFNFPRCDHIISASFDRTARIHSVATGECRAVLKGHRGEILCVASDQQGDLVATGSLDHTVRLWDFATGDELHTLAGHTAEVVCVQFSADGVRLLSGSFDHTVILWNVATGRPVKTLLMHREAISRAELSFDGAWILSGSVDRTAILWNTDTGEPTGTCKMPSEVMSVAFSPSGRQCAMATATGVIRLYTTEPFTFRHELAEHRGEVSKVMFNATGTRLASICSDHTVRLWCTSTGTCVKVFPHPDELIAIKFDYHADCFVTACKNNSIRVFR